MTSSDHRKREDLKSKLMLNLGCGVRTNPDWINIDWSLKLRLSKLPLLSRVIGAPVGVMIHDLRKGIPFGDATVDAVYSSHVLEHLQRSHARLFLREMFRVLKPGGTVRIVVPDLEAAVNNYLAALGAVRQKSHDRATLEGYEWCTILLLDQMVRSTAGGEMACWLKEHHDSAVIGSFEGTLKEIAKSLAPNHRRRGLKDRIVDFLRPSDPSRSGELHRWMYDDFSLKSLLESSGFSDVKRYSHLESRIERWQCFLLDNNADSTAHQPGSIWMEGTKLGISDPGACL